MRPYGQRGRISLPIRRDAGGKLLCSWCEGPVKPPRRSWCSQKCVDEWRERGDWNHIRKRIIERDKVCRICGGRRLRRSYSVEVGARPHLSHRVETHPMGHPIEYQAPYTVVSPGGWEVDHIVAVQDGGTDEPSNLRLLCSPCHRDITAAQRRAKALERRRQIPLLG